LVADAGFTFGSESAKALKRRVPRPSLRIMASARERGAWGMGVGDTMEREWIVERGKNAWAGTAWG
jgi:hypothetical protein